MWQNIEPKMKSFQRTTLKSLHTVYLKMSYDSNVQINCMVHVLIFIIFLSRLLDTVTLIGKTVGCYKLSLECKDQYTKFYSLFGFDKEEGQNYMCIRYAS